MPRGAGAIVCLRLLAGLEGDSVETRIVPNDIGPDLAGGQDVAVGLVPHWRKEVLPRAITRRQRKCRASDSIFDRPLEVNEAERVLGERRGAPGAAEVHPSVLESGLTGRPDLVPCLDRRERRIRIVTR